VKKNKITERAFDMVLWQKLGNALDKMPIQRRLFCIKHTSGMCGGGKFQRLWKQRESDACPHCGLPEDSLHVWKCRDPTVTPIWDNAINHLQQALHKLDTDPDIIIAIVSYLQLWRADQHLHTIKTIKLHHMLELQDINGAQQFFKGWVHEGWERLQVNYYNIIHSRRSGKRWIIALITKLWEIAWDLWDFRNTVYHQHSNPATYEDTTVLNQQVKEISYKLTLTGLLPKDKHLTSIPLSKLLTFPRPQKLEWITQANLALEQVKKQHFQLLTSCHAQHRRHQNTIRAMRLLLSNWLHQSN
jgi:hypothetical protein